MSTTRRVQTREQLKQWALRACGHPVVRVNVDDSQLEDRIDDALAMFMEFHFSGNQRVVLKVVIDAEMEQSKRIKMPERTLSVIEVFFPQNASINESFSNNLFNYSYVTSLIDVARGGSCCEGVSKYANVMQYLNTLRDTLGSGSGSRIFTYNEYSREIIFDGGIELTQGKTMLIDCFVTVDPDDNWDGWDDKWLKNYTSALFKRQWGVNLTKFVGVQYAGGGELNGQMILDSANQEIQQLEEELNNKYTPPLMFFVE